MQGLAGDSPRQFLWSIVSAQPRKLTSTVFASLVAAGFESFGVGLLVPVLQGVVDSSKPVPVPIIGRFVDHLAKTSTERLGMTCVIVIACITLRCVFGYLATISGASLAQRAIHDLRVKLFRQLTNVGLGYFGDAKVGSVVNTLTNELYRVEFTIGTFTNAVQSIALVAAYLTVLIVISPLLALLAMGLSAIVYLGLGTMMRRIRRAGEETSRTTDLAVAAFSERLSAARTIRAFAMEEVEQRKFEQLSDSVKVHRLREIGRQALVTPLTQGLMSAAIVGLVFVGFALLVSRGLLSGPLLLAFFFALFRLAPQVQLLLNGRAMYAANRVGLVSVAAILRTEDKPYVRSGTRAVGTLRTAIELANVDFSYVEGTPVLRNVSLRIEHGKTTALVGPSGSGKSTIADLVVRFHDPTSGAITWDGVDFRELDLPLLRRRFGIVSQETFVFNDTVRANVAYARTDSSDEAIWEVLELAGADVFVRGLASGLDTIVGERGMRLSGGERQRLAIARALLHQPDVLVLDEATSSLDAATERAVQHSLDRLTVGRTVLVIAHRLSTIEHADLVVVLEAGEVTETGLYEDLVGRGGGLARLHRSAYADRTDTRSAVAGD